MRIDRRSRAALRFHAAAFAVLAFAAWALVNVLATRHPLQADWTHLGTRSISEPSARLARRLEGTLRITAYARENLYTRRATSELVARYQRVKPDIVLAFVDPDRAPAEMRALGISRDGEMVLELGDRSARATQQTEASITNALMRLAQPRERWIVYLHGHGERDLLGTANHHLGRFGDRLEQRGYRVQGIELARAGSIPDNASVLVVSEPATSLLEGEIEHVLQWLANGGNMLWLSDPDAGGALGPIAAALGIERVPGTIVEPETRLYGLDDPALALSATYPPHPATSSFDVLTLYPFASGLTARPPQDWKAVPLVRTSTEAWSETGPLEGTIAFDEDADTAGPLDLAIALERPLEPLVEDGITITRHQRVVVVGDGDFLSNTYVGNVGNADLGMALVHWLAGDDALVDIPLEAPLDGRLELSRPVAGIIALGSLAVVPLAFAAIGVWVWLRRRHR